MPRSTLSWLVCIGVALIFHGVTVQGQEARGVSREAAATADAVSAKVAGEPAGAGKASAGEPGDKDGEPKGKDAATKSGEEERPRGLLGDTSRFTKMGGWGSIGGAMGQWGAARSMLIMMPPVQEELELTEEQKQKLRDWMEQMRLRGEEMRNQMRPPEGEDAFNRPGMTIQDRIGQFTNMMSQVSLLLQENENGIGRILEPGQRKRLSQIALQMEGINALSRPDVARAINLSPAQEVRIRQIVTGSRTMQMTTWMSRMAAMAASRGRNAAGPGAGVGPGSSQAPRVAATKARPTGEGSPGRPAPTPGLRGEPQAGSETGTAGEAVASEKGARGNDGNDREVDPERAERARMMRQQFETTRNLADEIQQRSVEQILKALTVKQRRSFERLLGEPFDPAQINNLQRPQREGEGGEPAQGTEPGAPKPADATPRSGGIARAREGVTSP